MTRSVPIRFSWLLILGCQTGCLTVADGLGEADDQAEHVSIETRSRWPAQEPVFVRVNYCGPVYEQCGVTTRATPTFKGGKPAGDWTPSAFTHVSWGSKHIFGDRTQCIGIPPQDATSLEFRVEHLRDDLTILNTVRRETISVPVMIGGAIDDVIQPVRSPELDQWLGQRLRFTLVRGGWDTDDGRSNRGNWALNIGGASEGSAIASDITFAVLLEILRDGEPIAQSDAWWTFASTSGNLHLRGDLDDFQSVWMEPKVPESIDANASWHVRMTAIPALALRNFEQSQYWAGELQFPLAIREHIEYIEEGVDFRNRPSRWIDIVSPAAP